MKMALSPLKESYNRKRFNFDNERINKFLKESANSAAKRNLSRTFVLEGSDETDIAGFCSLSNIEVKVPVPHKLNKKYPNPLPGVTLAKMGVDKGYQGQGVAKIMIVDAMRRTLRINQNMGVVGLFVDAKDDELVEFYQHRGFIFLQKEEHTSKLWMPIDSIVTFFKDRK
jgi:ribosomal protein S18 acetylase RimI-like enzyme